VNMIKKQWLDTIWINLFLIVFVNIIITGFLSYFSEDYTLLSIVSLALTCFLVGALHGFVFGKRIHYKLRIAVGLIYVALLLVLELLIFWQPGSFSLNMVIPRIILVLAYFAEIYFILEGSAWLMVYFIFKKQPKTKLNKKPAKKIKK